MFVVARSYLAFSVLGNAAHEEADERSECAKHRHSHEEYRDVEDPAQTRVVHTTRVQVVAPVVVGTVKLQKNEKREKVTILMVGRRKGRTSQGRRTKVRQ